MREYALSLKRYGICHDRYEELKHFCRQYDVLSEKMRGIIDKAAENAAGQYAPQLKKSVCVKDMPYRYIDIPYSESQFKRMRRQFYIYLDKEKEK